MQHPIRHFVSETDFDIQFLPEGDKTRVIVTQSGLPNPTWSDNATDGWSQQFEKLVAWLSAGGEGRKPGKLVMV